MHQHEETTTNHGSTDAIGGRPVSYQGEPLTSFTIATPEGNETFTVLQLTEAERRGPGHHRISVVNAEGGHETHWIGPDFLLWLAEKAQRDAKVFLAAYSANGVLSEGQ